MVRVLCGSSRYEWEREKWGLLLGISAGGRERVCEREEGVARLWPVSYYLSARKQLLRVVLIAALLPPAIVTTRRRYSQTRQQRVA